MAANNKTECPVNGLAKKVDDLMLNFVRPDKPSRCTWSPQKSNGESPHSVVSNPRMKVYPDILNVIGGTPLVRLNHIPQSLGIKCDMYAKCEFLNPGGSVKDRIGYRMVLEAEAKGILKPGSTIIEPTSGNTGIGLAMASAVHGYRCIIVMPEKMSDEKVNTLRALGAEIIRTPTEAAFDSPEGLIAVSQQLQRSIPNSVVLNQYLNAGNPLAHFDGTGDEIINQLDGKVDMVVLGAGTGGTITGIGRKIKEKCPNCVVVGVDPAGSILARPEELNKTDVEFYEVEGIGYDFIPTVLDHQVVDRWMKVVDQDALPMARRLIREEGFLCGGSSGAAMVSALTAAKDLKEGQKCVVLLPDNIRNYMTKMVSDNWMEARRLKEIENVKKFGWWDAKISDLGLSTPVSVKSTVSCREAVDIMRKQGVEQLAVVDDSGELQSTVTNSFLMTKFMNANLKPTDPVANVMFKKFVKLNADDKMGLAARVVEKEPFFCVVDPKTNKLVTIVSQKDVLQFIMSAKD